ncbi:MAG: PASTA domain-containing protein, partial [Erysipelothrix sp.]|nr:PASTA domain-containing protein [Erysipelothrix sp.]
KKGVKLLSNERVLLLTEKSNMSVPNMSGWSLKEVNAWANFARLEIITEGSGFVKEQSIAPKTKINQDMKIKVRLE